LAPVSHCGIAVALLKPDVVLDFLFDADGQDGENAQIAVVEAVEVKKRSFPALARLRTGLQSQSLSRVPVLLLWGLERSLQVGRVSWSVRHSHGYHDLFRKAGFMEVISLKQLLKQGDRTKSS